MQKALYGTLNSLFFSLFAEEICTLVIAETFPEDSGIFTCTATNEHGSVTSSAQLTVCSGMWRRERGVFSHKSYIINLPVELSVCFLCGKCRTWGLSTSVHSYKANWMFLMFISWFNIFNNVKYIFKVLPQAWHILSTSVQD